MNEDIKHLIEIDEELQNSEYKINDFITVLDKIYQRFEGYFGIKTDMEEWNLDENGDVIKHSHREYENYYYMLINKIYNMLINKEYKRLNGISKTDLELEYEKGRRYGYRSGLLDSIDKIKELV